MGIRSYDCLSDCKENYKINMLLQGHEIFIEVAANLSFSKASEILFISQPAISKHIKILEAFIKLRYSKEKVIRFI
ncbi:MAG: LysR family transcriptional regulator [Chitinophagaceae bacterium]